MNGARGRHEPEGYRDEGAGAGGVIGLRREANGPYAANMDLPVACALTEAELREGRKTIFDAWVFKESH